PSAFVAALFAWHPLHVESVAWAAERKDVLSTLFGLLAIWAYCKHQTSPRSTVHSPQSTDWCVTGAAPVTFYVSRFYVLSLLLFALGLMSKAMLVTLPCLLLLLDYWPLRRFELPRLSWQQLKTQWPALKPLILEKLPFFGLSLASSVATFLAQKTGGAVSD